MMITCSCCLLITCGATRQKTIPPQPYTYDAINHLKNAVSGSYSKNFWYDDADNITKITSNNVVVNQSFDAAHRQLTRKTTTNGVSGQISYSYDGNDNITRITYPSGTQANYTYNSLNQVTSITGFGGDLTNFTYHTSGTQRGLLKSYRRQNSQVVSFTWDARRNIYTSGHPQYTLNFRYDQRGNLTNYSQAGRNQTYGYDSVNRITSFGGPWGSGTYSYNVLDNLTKRTVGAKTTNYLYDTSNRLIKRNNTVISYTKKGDAFIFPMKFRKMA